jgi:hypothetical protein
MMLYILSWNYVLPCLSQPFICFNFLKVFYPFLCKYKYSPEFYQCYCHHIFMFYVFTLNNNIFLWLPLLCTCYFQIFPASFPLLSFNCLLHMLVSNPQIISSISILLPCPFNAHFSFVPRFHCYILLYFIACTKNIENVFDSFIYFNTQAWWITKSPTLTSPVVS